MEIIENWNLLNKRINNENPKLTESLFPIHMGAFEDLRKSGHMLRLNGTPVSQLAPAISAKERLDLAGNIGRSLIQAEGDLHNKRFLIKHADYFPNCIFIALAAIFENMDGVFDVRFPGQKMNVVCEYHTVPGNSDPLGKLLPLVEKCYPWVALSPKVHQSEPPEAKAPRFIQMNQSSLIFAANRVAKIDTMRTAFTGTIQRGEIKKGDVLNVIDSSGKVLCHEGLVLAIYANSQEINKAEANQRVDEVGLAVELPAGDYTGILLVDGDKKLASNQMNQNSVGKVTVSSADHISEKQSSKKKTRFWEKLFKK